MMFMQQMDFSNSNSDITAYNIHDKDEDLREY